MNKLGTKAETLKTLYGNIVHASVLPQFMFTVSEWQNQRDMILYGYEELEWNHNVIVRSSALNEDTKESSCAGKFESVLNVSGREAFLYAVDQVIGSYEDENPNNQILVQPMLEDVYICGVAFTLEPSTMGNYYVINYDRSGATDAITAGRSTEGKQELYYHFKKAAAGKAPHELRKVILFLQELEEFFSQDNLDVEFAIAGTGKIFCLQVRTLCVKGQRIFVEEQEKALNRISDKIRGENSPKPFLCGKRAVYSVMTDWNPAEMIGIRPKTLAMSLYEEVITDNVWAYQRDNYGYRNLRSFPLMVDFCGLPYIDVRVSFNSFIPAELDEEISEKLVNYYIDCLVKHPQKHDKAEFDIVFSCYTFDLPERIQILKDNGFNDTEIEKILTALRNVTNHIIDHKEGLWRKDYHKITILEKRYEKILSSDMSEIKKIYWLLEDCKRYGTLPFAGLARAAFIAVQILQSMVTCGIISGEDYEEFMRDVNTVSSCMNRDFKELSRSGFLKKYGHLRPGTYDISSKRYDEAPELYFDWGSESSELNETGQFRISLGQLNALKDKLQENGLTNNILDLMNFIKTVIEGREYGKFAFTRNLSKALQMIGEIGKREGMSNEDCAFIHIRTIRELYISTGDIRMNFLHSISQGKKDYEITKGITLPPFIADADEVFGFRYPDSDANYITSNNAVGMICVLDGGINRDEMKDRIVLIPSADPGYDWIFSHGIKGLITMYGGANSHMAIRAGELGIPAAVGIGAKDFERYKKAKVLEIDALAKQVRILK